MTGRDHSNAYAAAVGVLGIAFLLILSSSGVGQALTASLVGSGTTPGAVGTKVYDQQAMTTNYHMGNDPSLNWRWVQVVNAGSMLENKVINTISMPLKTHGVPAGIVNVAIWNNLNQKVYDFATINANQISATTMWYTFRSDSPTPHTLKAGDRIGIGFHAGNIANYLTAFGSNTNPVDSTFSHRQRYNGTHWVGSVNEDLTAVIGFSTGSGTGDTILPSVSITSPGQGATVNAPFTVTGVATDNVGVVSVDVKTEWTDPTHPCTPETCPPYQRATPTGPGGSWSTWSITLNPTKAAVVMATAKDAAGNQQWSLAININLITPGPPGDTTPPSISIYTPANSASIQSTTVGVTGVASDNRAIATITWSIDGSAFSPVGFANSGTSIPWSFSALDVPLGAHTITVRALDTAGLSATSQVIFTVTSTEPLPCPTGTTWDPVLRVCVGNPSDPHCPTGFTWNDVTERCDPDDLPDPNPIGMGNTTFWMAGILGVAGLVIATKAATGRKK